MRNLVLCILLCTSVNLAYADDDRDHEQALKMSQQGKIVSSQQLLDQTFKRYPDARLLEMKLKQKHHRCIYKIQLLTREGVVRKLLYDAQTGKLMRDKDDSD